MRAKLLCELCKELIVDANDRFYGTNNASTSRILELSQALFIESTTCDLPRIVSCNYDDLTNTLPKLDSYESTGSLTCTINLTDDSPSVTCESLQISEIK